LRHEQRCNRDALVTGGNKFGNRCAERRLHDFKERKLDRSAGLFSSDRALDFPERLHPYRIARAVREEDDCLFVCGLQINLKTAATEREVV
jgi:hypothetical protein